MDWCRLSISLEIKWLGRMRRRFPALPSLFTPVSRPMWLINQNSTNTPWRREWTESLAVGGAAFVEHVR
jgi:hypothetical protein